MKRPAGATVGEAEAALTMTESPGDAMTLLLRKGTTGAEPPPLAED